MPALTSKSYSRSACVTRLGRMGALPSDFFFDTLSDYRTHAIYTPDTIRIEAEEFQFLEDGLIAIEKCCGALSGLFKTDISPLPVEKSVLVFLPVGAMRGKAWGNVQEAIGEGVLAEQLLLADPFLPAYVADTRETKGFQGPRIFISYAVEDIDVAAKIANALYVRKRCYLFYGKAFQGIGSSPAENSISAIAEADAVVLVVSKSFAEKLTARRRTYVAQEFEALRNRFMVKKLPIIPIPADDFDVIDGIAWSDLGFTGGAPYLGEHSVRQASEDEFSALVDELIERAGTDRGLT